MTVGNVVRILLARTMGMLTIFLIWFYFTENMNLALMFTAVNVSVLYIFRCPAGIADINCLVR